MTERPDFVSMSPGALGTEHLDYLIKHNHITHTSFEPKVKASALDLAVTGEVWEVGQGQRPTTRSLDRILKLGTALQPDGEYFHFHPGRIYLVRLDAYLKLPGNITGRATGKSSIGRLDIITRLITRSGAEHGAEYDVVPAGYEGPL